MLRPYQTHALDEISKLYASGTRKVLLWLPTGGGKTVIFCEVAKRALAKGKRVLIVVYGRKLVDQASKRLDREGIDHGVMMSGHWRERPNMLVQVCSISTLYAKKKAPPADLVIIDEAHMSQSESFKWLVAKYPDSYFLPVTATPFVKKGLRHVADKVVKPATMRDLIQDGFLVPPVYYAPSTPDLSAVKVDKSTGDYRLSDLSHAMQKANLYGDMVKSYTEIANRKPALLFCVDVEHSQAVVESFVKAGIAAVHVDAKTPDVERNRAIENLEKGAISIISNVGIMTTGVDIPCVRCVILARPTKSYNLYMQICGRGTRPYPGKENFIVLDHADCVIEHGFITTERPCDLDGWKKEGNRLPNDFPVYSCEACYFVWERKEGLECPSCGLAKKAPERGAVLDTRYSMKKLHADINETPIRARIRELAHKAVRSNYKVGWIYYQLVEDKRFNADEAKLQYHFIQKIYKEAQQHAG